MNKKARDNRANQLNPNNPAYYKSRMGNQPKAKTQVVHHHHHHHHNNNYVGVTCTSTSSLFSSRTKTVISYKR